MLFQVWGESVKLDDSFFYKEGSLIITDVEFAFALIRGGTCFTDESIRSGMKQGTYTLKFGQRVEGQLCYYLSYLGEKDGKDQWMFWS